jgi:tRNA modification GTPase
VAGWKPHAEGVFIARERHVAALKSVARHLAVVAGLQPFELKAEELSTAQRTLGAITGEVSADDLLGEIFSRFCIGK